ncbi:MAG: B12-binding domain-containing radical SAM protein [Propionibacteriaceae bacterium]|nr:B12-binding domain-containing radical SAM protein [Propionibacteriaceae bacterium]
MRTIVYINPRPSIDRRNNPYSSGIINKIIGGKRAAIVTLSPMIIGALTPRDEYNFVFLDETIDLVDPTTVQADLVAITTLTVSADRAYQLSADFRARGIPVVLGGVHVTACPEEAAQHADTIFTGMGEYTWPAFLEDWKNGVPKPRYDAADYPLVDFFVTPRTDIIDTSNYLALPVMATRGCPYNCDFCCIPLSSGHKYLTKPVEDVMSEIRAWEACVKPGRIGAEKPDYLFVDDNLYIKHDYTRQLIEAMKELHVTWYGQGSIHTAADDEVIKLISESGCRAYSMGFESLNDENLAKMQKARKADVAVYQKALDNLRKHGIMPSGYFIVGFDGDDATVFEKTVDFVRENGVVQAVLSVLTPYPGTELRERLVREGRIWGTGWQLYNNWNTVINPLHMTSDELEAGFHWAVKQNNSPKAIKAALRKFFAEGPWPAKPRLRFIERLAFIYFALMMLPHPSVWPFARFCVWVAFQRNAVDFRGIISTLLTMEIGSRIKDDYYNPAERRRQRGLPLGDVNQLDTVRPGTPLPDPKVKAAA